MTFPLAAIGSLALVLLFVWLASAIAAQYLSLRKGYSEKAGLATGMLLSVVGVVVWLVVPAKAGSAWKTVGMFGRRDGGAGATDGP